jgi:hypothetical protein
VRLALALLGATLLGCAPPDDALVHGCASRGILELGSNCYVSAKRLEKDQLATFDAQTKNERVRVKATVRVHRGEVTIELPGCERGSGVAKPGQPFVVECDAKIDRNTYRLFLWARPKTKPIEGVEGDVSFRAI